MTRRPFVRLNMASSVDGKIATVGGGKVAFGSGEDRTRMEELRAEADAVLIGAGTLRAEDPPLLIRDPARRDRRAAVKGTPHPRNVVVSTRLSEPVATLRFFQEPATDKIVFTTDRSAPDQRELAARFARVEVVPADDAGRIDVAAVVDRLAGLGVEHLLLEGGGELNFSMFRAGLVDEVYLTLFPFVIGGKTAPTVCDGPGFGEDAVPRLALKQSRVGDGGELFLRYAVLKGDTP